MFCGPQKPNSKANQSYSKPKLLKAQPQITNSKPKLQHYSSHYYYYLAGFKAHSRGALCKPVQPISGKKTHFGISGPKLCQFRISAFRISDFGFSAFRIFRFRVLRVSVFGPGGYFSNFSTMFFGLFKLRAESSKDISGDGQTFKCLHILY